MVEIDFTGIDRFVAEVEALQRKFNNDITAKYREWIRTIFYDIVDLTPQWSGNLAANWYLGIGGQEASEQTIPEKTTYWPLPLYLEPHERGDEPAVSISHARFEEAIFGYNDRVYIYNPTDIAPEVEAHSIYIRGVNLLDGRVAMIAHAAAFYSTFSPPL